jgi:hypothetical protein
VPSFTLFDTLREEALNDPAYAELRRQQAKGSLGTKWGFIDGLFTYSGRMFVPPTSPSFQTILAAVHNAGREGVQKTLHRIRRDFHLQQAKKVVEDFVRTCVTCQCNKSVQLQPGGLLQSLEVPTQVWADISMDFIEGLPSVHGKSVILSVVDRFSKAAHFIPDILIQLQVSLMPSSIRLFTSMEC